MNPHPAIHATTVFSHQTRDRVAHIAAFTDRDCVSLANETGVPLGNIALAPARAASITGDQLSLVLRLYPTRGDALVYYLSKGSGQYELFQPDEEHLVFRIRTDEPHELMVSLPEGWYDSWHTLVAVYTGQELRLYLDGVLTGENPASGLICYHPGALLLGAHPFRQSAGRGVVGELQIYDRALAERELGASSEGCRLDFRFDDLFPFENPAATTETARQAESEWQEVLNDWRADDAALQDGTFSIESQGDTDWSDVVVDWQIQTDGNTLQHGSCPVGWRKSDRVATLELNYALPEPYAGTSYWLDLYFLRHTGEERLPLGGKQFPLPLHAPPAPGPDPASLAPIEIREKDNTGYFQGDNFSLEIDLPTATIISWKVDAEELLELGPIHQFWQAPSWKEVLPDEDGNSIAIGWSRAGLAENIMGVTSMEALQDRPAQVTMKFQGLIIRRNSDVLFEITRDYVISGNGEVLLEQTLTPTSPLCRLPRHGLELRLAKDMNDVTWFGMGPQELATDTQAWDMMGRHAACGDQNIAAEGWPVERGQKQCVHWITLRNQAGRGLYVGSETPFTASVSPYSTFQLSEALHYATLTPDSALTLQLDQASSPSEAPPANTPLKTRIRMRGLLPEDTAPWDVLKRGVPVLPDA